jgi:hypothetical protein
MTPKQWPSQLIEAVCLEAFALTIDPQRAQHHTHSTERIAAFSNSIK